MSTRFGSEFLGAMQAFYLWLRQSHNFAFKSGVARLQFSPMERNSKPVLGALLILTAFLIPWKNALCAQEPPDRPEGGLPAYATSLAFDLRPQVERASFHLRRPEVRTLYQAIADAYGIRLIYDRDFRDRPLTSNFDLENATLPEALEAAASVSSTFVAPLDERTGIVAADTPQKRGEYERQVLRSLHADAQTTPQQLTEISNALRTLVDLRYVVQDTRSSWITVRGRTRQVAVAEQFFQTLQKIPGEVMVEVEVWEINSRRARELGILPPQPFVLQFLGYSRDAATTRPSVPSVAPWIYFMVEFLGHAQPVSSPSTFTFGAGRTRYQLNLPSAIARANFISSVVRSHQTLQLRASHGQQASLLLGQRFPLVTATVGSSFTTPEAADQPGSLAFYPTIQYEDLGVVAKVTPYLHAGQELTLQLDLAIRDLGSQELGDLPTIVNRQMTGQIRLKDGESYLITGIRSRAEQRSRSGYPWISRVPVIGALFGLWRKQQEESEFWVLIRPRILRSSPAEEFASRTIFFGKELTGLPAAPQPPPAEPTPEEAPPQPGVVPQPGVPIALPPGAEAPPGVPVQPGFPPETAPEEGAVEPVVGPDPFIEPEEQPEPPSPQP